MIELLVVLSIIALLIALLLPSLQNARTHAQTLLCMTHTRSMSAGVYMYAADNDGWVARDYFYGGQLTSKSAPHLFIAELITPYVGGPTGPLIPPALEDWSQNRDKYLAAIFKDMEVFQCPSFPDELLTSGPFTATHPYSGESIEIKTLVYDYAVNGFDLDVNRAGLSSPASQMEKMEEKGSLSSMIMLLDTNAAGRNISYFGVQDMFNKGHLWTGGGSRMINDDRHNGNAPLIYFDGHGDILPYQSIGIPDMLPAGMDPAPYY